MKRLLRRSLALALISIGLLLGTQGYARAEEIDIRQLPEFQDVIQEIEKALPKPGNSGYAELESLTFDTDVLEVYGSAKIVAKHSWGEVRNPFTGKDVDIAAQKTFHATFTYNLETNRIRGDVSLGEIELSTSVLGKKYSISLGEVKVDLERLQRAVEGDLIAVAELIPTPPGTIEIERRNEYERIRNSKWDQYGRDNVYFASQEFVDWASPERAGFWVIEAIVTGGASTAATMAEVTAESMKELTALVAWLEMKGVDEAQTVAEQLLRGQRVDWPFLAVYWQTVKYEARRLVGGVPVTPWIPVRHAAFYIVWKGTGAGGSAGSGGASGTGSDSSGAGSAGNGTSAVVCANTYPTRLQIGDRATVSFVPPYANLVRVQPNGSATVVGRIQPGEGMVILAGPECANDRIWWYVRSDNNVTGWTSEGDSSDYWLVPASATAVTPSLLPIENCRSAGSPAGPGQHVMQYYGITELCTVGPMVYYLVNQRPPQGAMPGEDCVAFNPQALRARPDLKAIIDAQTNNVLFWQFETGEQVTNAYNIILHHGFTHACYVGRGSPNRTYLRQ